MAPKKSLGSKRKPTNRVESKAEAAADAILSAHPGMPMKALWTALTDEEPLAVVVALVKDERCGLERRSQQPEGEMKFQRYCMNGGATPLLLAALANRSDVATSLIADGADVRAVAIDRSTALHFATDNGDVELIKLLAPLTNKNPVVEHNNKNMKSNKSNTTKKATVCSEETLLNARTVNGEQALHLAAYAGNTVIIELLTTLGAHVDALDDWGATPISLSAGQGELEAVEMLLRLGADTQTANSSFPLHLAASRGYATIVEALAECGADLDLRQPVGVSALHVAAGSGLVEVIRTLFRWGVAVSTVDAINDTPLHHAAQNGFVDAVKLLADFGINIHSQNCHGRTALHFACKSGTTDAFEVLIHLGANTDIPDKDGRTALHLAAEKGLLDLAESMLSAGASPDVFDNYRWWQERPDSEEMNRLFLVEGVDLDELAPYLCHHCGSIGFDCGC